MIGAAMLAADDVSIIFFIQTLLEASNQLRKKIEGSYNIRSFISVAVFLRKFELLREKVLCQE